MDMDGVIFRTVMAKHDAMLGLFPTERREVVSQAILSLSGIPRREKLHAVHRECFAKEATESQVEAYLEAYALALTASLQSPALAPGIKSFIEQLSVPVYVCSSAPTREVTQMLEAAGIVEHFKGIYGSPLSKASALRQVAQTAKGSVLVYFGDAPADQAAAEEVGACFVAVAGELDQFPHSQVAKVQDFTNLCAVQSAIERAIVANAA